MEKRLLALALALVIALAAAGCGGEERAGSEQPQQQETEEPEQTPAWEPDGPVSLLVPDTLGSLNDITARVLAQYLERYIGQTVNVEDIPGAVTQVNELGETVTIGCEGSNGWAELARRRPDGLSLGYVRLPDFTRAMLQWPELCPMESFEPVCTHTTQTAVLVVRQDDERFASLQALVEYGRANAGALIAATDGALGLSHTWTQMFARDAGFSYTASHQASESAAVSCVQNGSADFCVVVADEIMERDAGLRVLGVFSDQRLSKYPDAPTLGEAGYYGAWQGCAYCVLAPAGVPSEAVKFYENAFQQAMSDTRYLAASTGVITEYRDAQETEELISQQKDLFVSQVASIW